MKYISFKTLAANPAAVRSSEFHKENVTITEPNHYLRSIERYGIICYKKLGDPLPYHAFAWQNVENSKLFIRFDADDRHFIELLAIRERQDEWYQTAGQRLINFGFKKFTEDSTIL